ncbi:MAG TPA: DUF3187 family protein [Steroidobacteraceae bacterium]|nr:DUF3187 family protein [Steroidobacteraceae bacterium]
MCRSILAAFLAAAAAYGPPLSAAESDYLGLVRARDLSTFGFLRLDMRPAHAVHSAPGTWAIETELAHQNTWALSSGAREYLDGLSGRRSLGPAEVADIRALPGENYVFDMELAELDVTLHYKFTEHWGGYLVLSGVNYSGGFLDSTIESFHDAFGFDDNARPAVEKDAVNLIADLNTADIAVFGAPTTGGLLDPTIGVRYSSPQQLKGWNYVVEAAAKLALQGEEEFLSTGKSDYGVQATLQRFGDHHAWYVSASAVYYDGRSSITPTDPQVVPTLVLGYERKLNDKTHLVLQTYISDSIYSKEDTRLESLLDTKMQLSLGIYRRMGRGVLSFAFTENLQNFNNTPDVGLLLGWAYSPALAKTSD